MYGESQFYTPYEQDVPYGMSQDFPQPMGNMNSMQQGYPTMGLPFSNNSQMPQYAKGGRVNTLSKTINQIRGMGQREDTVLAHINPEEAEELYAMHGGDVNPRTGLPQFGKFKLKRFLPAIARTAAAAIGNMLGGPVAGTAAASLVGGLVEKGKGGNFGKGLLKGAIHGGLQSFGLPMAGNAMGVNPASGMGSFMGMNAPKFGNLAGIGSLGGQRGAFQGLQNIGKSQGPSGMGGLLSSGNVNNLLLGSALLGTLGAKYKTPKGESLQNAINNGPQWSPDQYPRQTKPFERSLTHFDPKNFAPGFEPEMLYYDEVNPRTHFEHGGHVHAFQGHEGGQSDKIPVGLPKDSYVIDASTVSDLGDGSSMAGTAQLKHLVNSAMKRKKYKQGGSAKGVVPAMVSPTEVLISKEAVDALGKGNNAKGASMLKNMVKNVRKHKRSSTKGLPPKAKNIKAYLGSK